MIRPQRSVRRRLGAIALAAAFVAALGLGSAALAQDDERYDQALERWWEGETLNLPWDGSSQYQTVSGDAFMRGVVAVPGDWVHRTLAVRNNGPCPGTLTVEILNPNAAEFADTVNQDDTSVTAGRIGFAGMSEIHWDVAGQQGASSFADLTHEQPLAEVPILKNQVVRVQLAYSYPVAETEGKNLGGASQLLEFDVGLDLRGDYCAAYPSPSTTVITHTDGPSPSGQTPGNGDSGTPKTPAPRNPLEFTGSNVLFACISALFLLAAGVTATLGSARRRRSRST
ncbi:MAG: hypothetical protein LBS27_09400 [Bifidobacteriaceae bacterium]|jgi:hypothetical protein|nr:hypothetical protein [Bifidobacteriaceae bacterium]